jgi:hypothetical protein
VRQELGRQHVGTMQRAREGLWHVHNAVVEVLVSVLRRSRLLNLARTLIWALDCANQQKTNHNTQANEQKKTNKLISTTIRTY